MAAESRSMRVAGRTRPLDWKPILPIFLVAGTYAAGMAAVLPVLPFYVRDMGGSPLILGTVLATEALGQFVSAPVLGQLSDRFGRKRVLLGSQIVAAASLLLLAGAPSIVFILLARALFGMTAGNLSVATAYVADHSTPGNRRQAIGILTGSVGLGGIVGATLSGLLSSDALLTAPIHAALALTAISTMVTFFLREDRQGISRVERQAAGGKILVGEILGSPAIRVLVIVMLCHFFAYGMYSSQMPVFLADTFFWNGHAFGPQELSYVMAADGVINVLVQLFLLGWLGRHLNERNLILLIFVLVSSGFLAASLATTIPALALAIVLVCTGDALAKPTYLATLSMHVPPQRQGIAMGATQALVAVTDITSPMLGGFILGYALYGVWIGVAIAIAIAGALVTVARIPNAIRVDTLEQKKPA